MIEVLVVLSLLSLIPAAIARSKGKSFGAWWVYGFFLWPIAVIHAAVMKPDRQAAAARIIETEDRRKCPYCAELIKAEAKVCRFCQREVPPTPPAIDGSD